MPRREGVNLADLEAQEAEFNAADRAYREKLNGLIAMAKAVLAAKPSDAGVKTGDEPNLL